MPARRKEDLREKVFDLHSKGMLQQDIAKAVGLTQPRISVLLKERNPRAWQPMATAPKDGTSILGAAITGNGIWGMGITRWSDNKWHLFPSNCQPMRWMQLPEPPKK